MVADAGAELTAFSVNHGAGRSMSRTAAKAQLRAADVEKSLADADVISNRRHYPIDEAPMLKRFCGSIAQRPTSRPGHRSSQARSQVCNQRRGLIS